MRKHISRTLWGIGGVVALILGIIGIPLPLLPTTPFLLLAAFCFSQSNERLHSWLVDHPKLGPPIRDWNKHGAISHKAKAAAVLAMAGAFIASYLFGAPTYVLGIQIVVLSLVSLFLLTRPSPPRH